jgi:hypothetical protein
MVTLPQLSGPGVDYEGQPLLDAWFTPGWTSQNERWLVAQGYGLSGVGWPADVPYAHVTHTYADMEGNALGGYLTFMPSDTVQYTESGTTWTLPPRPCGVTPWPVSYGALSFQGSYLDSGKIFLTMGSLECYQLCSDASGLVTLAGDPLTFHVTEHWLGGSQFDISTPSASADPVDLYALMLTGSQQPYQFDPRQPMGEWLSAEPDTSDALTSSLSTQSIVYGSTEYIVVDLTAQLPNIGWESLTGDAVSIAVLSSATAYPQDSDWWDAQWLTDSPPYMAGLMEGPGPSAAFSLAVGAYKVWVKLVITPEIPVIRAGTLFIT